MTVGLIGTGPVPFMLTDCMRTPSSVSDLPVTSAAILGRDKLFGGDTRQYVRKFLVSGDYIFCLAGSTYYVNTWWKLLAEKHQVTADFELIACTWESANTKSPGHDVTLLALSRFSDAERGNPSSFVLGARNRNGGPFGNLFAIGSGGDEILKLFSDYGTRPRDSGFATIDPRFASAAPDWRYENTQAAIVGAAGAANAMLIYENDLEAHERRKDWGTYLQLKILDRSSRKFVSGGSWAHICFVLLSPFEPYTLVPLDYTVFYWPMGGDSDALIVFSGEKHRLIKIKDRRTINVRDAKRPMTKFTNRSLKKVSLSPDNVTLTIVTPWKTTGQYTHLTLSGLERQKLYCDIKDGRLDIRIPNRLMIQLARSALVQMYR